MGQLPTRRTLVNTTISETSTTLSEFTRQSLIRTDASAAAALQVNPDFDQPQIYPPSTVIINIHHPRSPNKQWQNGKPIKSSISKKGGYLDPALI